MTKTPRKAIMTIMAAKAIMTDEDFKISTSNSKLMKVCRISSVKEIIIIVLIKRKGYICILTLILENLLIT